MDAFDLNEDSSSFSLDPKEVILNIITTLVLLSVVCVSAAFLMIYLNPQSGLNPFPPPTLPVAIKIPTQAPTATSLFPATWTPAPTAPATASPTLLPTSTMPPTPTRWSIVTPPPSPTPTRPPNGYPFALKGAKPLAVTNIAYPDKACNWMGVAGTVEDLSGQPRTQLIVTLGGLLAGKQLAPGNGILFSLTGVAPSYGQAGYEFVLGEKPVASKNTLWVQLVDQAGLPLSDKVAFETFADCNRNLIIISFRQVR